MSARVVCAMCGRPGTAAGRYCANCMEMLIQTPVWRWRPCDGPKEKVKCRRCDSISCICNRRGLI